jgi:DNA mismatch repair protein MutH
VKEFQTDYELLNYASEIIDRPIRKIDKTGRLSTGKGAVGSLIEESWFEYTPNNKPEPDFENLGIELKVTPYFWKNIKGNNVVRAKERLVCNMIDYMEEHMASSFEHSAFYKKCNTMLLMFYEYFNDISKGDFMISEVRLVTIDQAKKDENHIYFTIPRDDVYIMRQDWSKIVEKIRIGQAHNLTESDTLYLAACTKGANSGSVRKQPFSEVPAKSRAYSLKQSYMTSLLNKYIFNIEPSLSIVDNDTSSLAKSDFENYILNKVKPFYGMTTNDLANKFGLTPTAKNLNERIIASILGISGRISDTTEFKKSGTICKTIRVEENDKIIESMSFPKIDFEDLTQSEWEDSDINQTFGQSRMLFVIFKNNGSEYVLSEVKFWAMPDQDLEEVHKVWKTARDLIVNDTIEVGGKHGFSVTNFPKSSDNPVSHIRPHDADLTKGKVELPNGKMIANYCFWLNNDYVAKQISNG